LGSLLGEGLLAFFLGFLVSLCNELGVLGSLSLALDGSLLLDGEEMSLSLDGHGGNQSLDLGCLGSLGLALLLGELTADDVLADVVLLGQVEQLSDLGSSLGAQSSGDVLVGQIGDFSFALLHDNQVDHRKIGSNNATSNRLSLSLSSSSGSVALGTLSHQKSDSCVGENSLLHGETLFVISTSDFEDVSLVFISKSFTVNFLGDSLVIQGSQFLLVIDFDAFLRAARAIRNIQLHD